MDVYGTQVLVRIYYPLDIWRLGAKAEPLRSELTGAPHRINCWMCFALMRVSLFCVQSWVFCGGSVGILWVACVYIGEGHGYFMRDPWVFCGGSVSILWSSFSILWRVREYFAGVRGSFLGGGPWAFCGGSVGILWRV